MKFILSPFFLIILCIQKINCDEDYNNYLALSALYTSATGESWSSLDNWMNGYPCTNGWEDVTCTGTTVISVVRNAKSLAGTLPSELGTLTAMTQFFLYNNKVSGSLPSQFGLLTAMKVMSLSVQSITGSIPSELGLLSVITKMPIYNNRFSGTIPSQLGRLTASTSEFQLSQNSLTGSVPTQMGLLTKMTGYFELSYNSLTGSLPSQLGALSLMTTGYNLYVNDFCGAIPSELSSLSSTCSCMGDLTYQTGLGTACAPTLSPTMQPNVVIYTPSLRPVPLPSTAPTPSPIPAPTLTPTPPPSNTPTDVPTFNPTSPPSPLPTNQPTILPIPIPSLVPLPGPTSSPSIPPTPAPTLLPTSLPTSVPSILPTPLPTTTPSSRPTPSPTLAPSPLPTSFPSLVPTPLPTFKPSSSPSFSPTLVPTVHCESGTYYDGLVCEPCPIGYYSNLTDKPPWPSNCTICPAGKYSTVTGAALCEDCAAGKLSSEDRTYCKDCDAGEYNYNNLECVECEYGKYAPQALTDSCLTCGAGFHTNNKTRATSCTACNSGEYSSTSTSTCSDCPIGHYSSSGASACTECAAGTYADVTKSSQCSSCGAGTFSEVTASVNCSGCPGGKYQSSPGQALCDDCSIGSYSSISSSTSCVACAAGTYTSNTTSVDCLLCPKGQYQGSTGQGYCLDCEGGKVAADHGASSCTSCLAGYWSEGASDSCRLAAEDYYLHPTDHIATLCLSSGNCAGGDRVMAPNQGYWVDRSSYAFIPNIHKCSRQTCTGANSNHSCWKKNVYNDTITDDTSKAIVCDSNKLLCLEGSQGPLCGSCSQFYIYRSSEQICKSCTSPDLTLTIVTMVSIVVFIILIIVVAMTKFREHEEVKRVLKCFDAGSVKVIWVTYQIIMSCSWNLDIKFPYPFNDMLGLLSIFSLDFLALECLQKGSPSKRYFVTVYLWSVLPIIVCFLLIFIGMLRYFVLVNYQQQEKKKKNHYRQNIINQHVYFILLLTYCVLPPVANKQLQSLDCVPLSRENINFLRSDSKINCDAKNYIEFKTIMIFFIILYQSIPICWMLLLYQYKNSLYVSSTHHDEKLSIYIRDRNRSLDKIRFLFNDYRTPKWWFEVAEMYRRILFVGVLPLTSTVNATRASFGCVVAMASVAYFREERPYRYRFTNFIAYVAQVAILITFYAALSIETGVMMDFGLGGLGMGLFLVLTNLVIFGLLLFLAYQRFKRERKQRNAIVLTASRTEDASHFSAEKFITTFTAISHRSVPASHVLLFHYTSFALGQMARRSGIAALKKYNGIAFSLRCPNHTAPVERHVFSNSDGRVDSWDGSAFPNNEVIVLALPRHLLQPLPGYEDDPCLCCLSAPVLQALRASTFATVLDNSPWIEGIVMLPPQCILRSYALVGNDDHKQNHDLDEEDEEMIMIRKQWIFEEQSHQGHDRGKRTDVRHIHYVESFLGSMHAIREQAAEKHLLPLYHYTSPDVIPLILKTGLRMSTQGQGDGGVYFSTRGPISYGLGKRRYEDHIIKDCFGVARLDEYRGQGKLDAVIVYGCEERILLQAPGGRDNAKMVPRSTFNDIMLPQFDGTYFMRPDRILGIFVMNNVRMFAANSMSPRISVRHGLSSSSRKDNQFPSSPTPNSASDRQDSIMEGCISEARNDKTSLHMLDLFEVQVKTYGNKLVEISNSLLPTADFNDNDEEGGSGAANVAEGRSRSRVDSIVDRLSESFTNHRPTYFNNHGNVRRSANTRLHNDGALDENGNAIPLVRFSENPLFEAREGSVSNGLHMIRQVSSKASNSFKRMSLLTQARLPSQNHGDGSDLDIEMSSPPSIIIEEHGMVKENQWL